MPRTKKLKPRQELHRIEKRIYHQNQQIIRDSSEVIDKNFTRYENAYRRSTRDYQKTATTKELERLIKKSRIVLVGDYHTLDQSQRSFVRVLRSYFRHQDKNILVALETIQNKHQRILDCFMASVISDQDFIKKIGFQKHWFFDLWENYTVIFDFLKYHAIPTYAIEADNAEKRSLKERDVFMAERIVELAQKNPGKVIFVLVGDLHLAPNHLPNKILRVAKRNSGRGGISPPAILALYQNSPDIYWQLSEKNLVDHTLLVKIRDREYCRMHTPPIIVQQSYLNWLYQEEGAFDWIDAKSSFVGIVERLATLLEIKYPADHDNIEVYTCGDLSFMRVLRQGRLFNKKELRFIHGQVLRSQSYFMAKARVAYIANVSIHHAAEEASHYLKFLLSGLEKSRSHRDAFYANVLHEALGFFGSKIINAKRKCARFVDFVAEIKYLKNAELMAKRALEYDTAVIFIESAKLARRGQILPTQKITHLSQDLFLALTHALGYDLGDHLYYAFMAGQIGKEKIREIFFNPFEKEGEPGALYLQLVKILKDVKRPPKM
jgi:uncharacterized iron-regulated protein